MLMASRCIPMLSVVGRRCPAAKNHGGAAAPPYLVIYRELVDALWPPDVSVSVAGRDEFGIHEIGNRPS